MSEVIQADFAWTQVLGGLHGRPDVDKDTERGTRAVSWL